MSSKPANVVHQSKRGPWPFGSEVARTMRACSCTLALALVGCGGETQSTASSGGGTGGDRGNVAEGGNGATGSGAAVQQEGGASDTSWILERPRYCDTLTSIDEETAFGANMSSQPAMPTPAIYGRVNAILPELAGEPCPGVAGVEVCAYETGLCTETDADGFYALGGLISEGGAPYVEITYAKEGYETILRQFTGSGIVRMFGPSMLPIEDNESTYGALGVTRDATRGTLQVLASGVGSSATALGVAFLGGVEMQLSPPTGSRTYYAAGTADPDRRWAIDPELTSTAEGAGFGWWLDLEPGDYTVNFTRDGQPLSGCVALPHAGLGLDPVTGGLLVRVRAGLVTSFGGIYCQTP